MNNRIHFILTGGTIDKIYDPIGQTTKLGGESTVPTYLKDFIKPNLDMIFEPVCMEDSLNITPAQREEIAAATIRSDHKHIIITHGTDTMDKTAEVIKSKLPADNDKTIIITGALIPINGFTMSDGGFNIGFAVSSALRLPPGVYVTMHAQVFDAGRVRKNTETARFEVKK